MDHFKMSKISITRCNDSTIKANLLNPLFSDRLTDWVLQHQFLFKSSLYLGKLRKVEDFISALLCLIYCLYKTEIAHSCFQLDLTVLI